MALTKTGNKYNAKGVKVDDKYFDSDAEYRRWRELELLERGGAITELEFHPKYKFTIRGVTVGKYEADSRYFDIDRNVYVIEDVKSPVTAKLEAYKLKKALMLAVHGLVVTEVFMPPKPRAKRSK